MNKMKVKVFKGFSTIEDGNYEGTISKLEETLEPFHYIDIYVKFNVDGKDIERRCGVPATIGTDTKLGVFLKNMGIDVDELLNEAGEDFDLDELKKDIVNKKVKFVVISTTNRDGRTFPEIVSHSIKPVDKKRK